MSVNHVVLFSSGGAVYGIPERNPVRELDIPKPISPYGFIKLILEKYMVLLSHHYGLKYLVIRPSNPYGPRQDFTQNQGVISIFLYKMLKGEPLEIWGDGSAVKDFIYIRDLASGITGLIDQDFDNEVYNISSGTGISINNLIELLVSITGIKPEIKYVDPHPNDIPRIIASNKKIRKHTGWHTTTSLEEGLQKTWEWIKSEPERIQ